MIFPVFCGMLKNLSANAQTNRTAVRMIQKFFGHSTAVSRIFALNLRNGMAWAETVRRELQTAVTPATAARRSGAWRESSHCGS